MTISGIRAWLRHHWLIFRNKKEPVGQNDWYVVTDGGVYEIYTTPLPSGRYKAVVWKNGEERPSIREDFHTPHKAERWAIYWLEQKKPAKISTQQFGYARTLYAQGFRQSSRRYKSVSRETGQGIDGIELDEPTFRAFRIIDNLMSAHLNTLHTYVDLF